MAFLAPRRRLSQTGAGAGAGVGAAAMQTSQVMATSTVRDGKLQQAHITANTLSDDDLYDNVPPVWRHMEAEKLGPMQPWQWWQQQREEAADPFSIGAIPTQPRPTQQPRPPPMTIEEVSDDELEDLFTLNRQQQQQQPVFSQAGPGSPVRRAGALPLLPSAAPRPASSQLLLMPYQRRGSRGRRHSGGYGGGGYGGGGYGGGGHYPRRSRGGRSYWGGFPPLLSFLPPVVYFSPQPQVYAPWF